MNADNNSIEKPLATSHSKIWGWLLLFSALFVLYAAMRPLDPNTSKRIDFQVECEYAVKPLLKAPRTAKFNDGSLYYRQEDETYTYIASVDAENSFGANIRTNFLCTGKIGPDGKVTIDKSMLE